MTKWLKKRDIILIVILLGVSGIILLIWQFIYSTKGNSVIIQQHDEIIGTYPLNEDKVIPIEYKNNVTNQLVIKDGVCYMEKAECPDHLCIKQGRINKQGQTIVCLPNRIIVTVIGDNMALYDSIAQ